MPFPREASKFPTRISRVTIHLAVFKSETAVVTYDDTAEIGVVLSDDSGITRTIKSLSSELTAAQRTAIKNLLDALLLRAETEIL